MLGPAQYEYQFAQLLAAQSPKRACNQQLMEFASSLADRYATLGVSAGNASAVVGMFISDLRATSGDDDYEPQSAALLYGAGYDTAAKFHQALMASQAHKQGRFVISFSLVCFPLIFVSVSHTQCWTMRR